MSQIGKFHSFKIGKNEIWLELGSQNLIQMKISHPKICPKLCKVKIGRDFLDFGQSAM